MIAGGSFRYDLAGEEVAHGKEGLLTNCVSTKNSLYGPIWNKHTPQKMNGVSECNPWQVRNTTFPPYSFLSPFSWHDPSPTPRAKRQRMTTALRVGKMGKSSTSERFQASRRGRWRKLHRVVLSLSLIAFLPSRLVFLPARS